MIHVWLHHSTLSLIICLQRHILCFFPYLKITWTNKPERRQRDCWYKQAGQGEMQKCTQLPSFTQSTLDTY